MTSRPARDRADRGFAVPLVALSLVVLITSTAFAVDLGRQMLLRRDLQADADVIALDLARLLDGRTTAELDAAELIPTSDVATTRDRAAAANDIDPALVGPDEIVWGTWSYATDSFTPTAPAVIPSAVQVTITDTISYFFASAVGISDNTSTRSAVAGEDAVAAAEVGSYLAGMDADDVIVLNRVTGFVGAPASFDLAGWRGLASASFSYDDLATQLGFGSPSELFAGTVQADQLFIAAATLLAQEAADSGDSDQQLAAVQLDNWARSIPNNRTVDLRRFGEIGPGGDEAAEKASINLPRLMTASAFLITGNNFIDISTLNLGIGNLTNTVTQVKVIEAPVFWAGRVGSTASTAQTTIDMDGTITATSLGAVSGVFGASVNGTITSLFEGVSATGSIDEINCGTPSVTLGAVTSAVTPTIHINLTLTVTPLSALGIPLAPVSETVAMQVTQGPPATGGSAEFLYPDEFTIDDPTNDPDPNVPGSAYEYGPKRLPVAGQPHSLGLGNLAITVTDGVDLSVLSSVANNLLTKLVGAGGVVPTLLTNIDTKLIGRLSPRLGLNIGGADLWAKGMSCIDLALLD